MAPLRIVLATLMLLGARTAHADTVRDWQPYIEDASAQFGIPVEWIARVMRAESGGRTTMNGRPIVSHAGAMGLMQIMPGTWIDIRTRLGLGRDPHHPRDNILAGTYYLRLMYDRFGYPGLFGAYNAGPGRYARHIAAGRPLPRETRAYLASVGGVAAKPIRETSARPQEAIFFALGGKLAAADTGTGDRPILFVALRSGQDAPARTDP